MKKILEQYQTLYHQIIHELAINGLSSKERRILIEMLYNTEINIQQAKAVIKS